MYIKKCIKTFHIDLNQTMLNQKINALKLDIFKFSKTKVTLYAYGLRCDSLSTDQCSFVIIYFLLEISPDCCFDVFINDTLV